MLVDSHCHLNYGAMKDDIAGVIARAEAAGVKTLLAINARLAEFEEVRAIAQGAPHVWASVGVHPHEAAAEPDIESAALLSRAAHPKVIGIGETGLDYYYEHAPRAMQQANFRAHIAAARDSGLPLIVHSRDAEDDTAAILREEMAKGAFAGVIHCFTASAALAHAALELGFYISLSGILTFKSAGDLQAIAADIPRDRLLVETDAPYLAPVPLRGRPCEPAYVVHTARFLAALRREAFADLAAATTENFFRLFTKARAPA
ncbi:MAG: TatD family hydrolase [Pseudomonadota bacterium]